MKMSYSAFILSSVGDNHKSFSKPLVGQGGMGWGAYLTLGSKRGGGAVFKRLRSISKHKFPSSN